MTTVNTLTEKIEKIGNEMLERSVPPLKIMIQLDEIIEKTQSLSNSDQMAIHIKLAELMVRLENQRKKKSIAEELLEMLKIIKDKEENNDIGDDENNAKCDGDCKNCSKDVEKKEFKVGIDFDKLDEEEKEEIKESVKNGNRRDVPVIINEHLDATVVVPQIKISKFELSIILKNFKKDIQDTLMKAGVMVCNDTKKVKGLHLKFIAGKDIVVELGNMEFKTNGEKIEFCHSFTHKYLA